MPGFSWTDPIVIPYAEAGSFELTTAMFTLNGNQQGTIYLRMDMEEDGRLWDFQGPYRSGQPYLTATFYASATADPAATRYWRGYSYSDPFYTYYGPHLWLAVQNPVINGTPTLPASLVWTSEDPPAPRPYTMETAELIDMSADGSVAWDAINPQAGDRYYKFTVTEATQITFTTGWTSSDLWAGVYRENYSTWVGGLEDGTSFTIGVEPGYLYILELDTSYIDSSATGVLSWDREEPEPPPAYTVTNDLFATPIVLDLSQLSLTYDNTGAGVEASAPPGYTGDEVRSIWYQFTVTTPTVVRFTATPSDADPARVPYLRVFRDDSTPEVPNNWTSPSVDEAVAQPGVDYRLRLHFPDGHPGRWETAGALSWTLTPPPSNQTPETAVDITPTHLASLQPLASYTATWVKVTVPATGGFMLTLGDGASPAPASPIGLNAWVFSEGQVLNGTATYESALKYLTWSSTPVVGVDAAGTPKYFVQEAEAGDVFYVQIWTQNWPGGDIPFRVGVSTDVTFTDWVSTDNVVEGTFSGDARSNPFYFNAPGFNHDTSRNRVNGANFKALAHLETPSTSGPSAHNFGELRTIVDSGQVYSNHPTLGGDYPAVPTWHPGGLGTDGAVYEGYFYSGVVEGTPGTMNEMVLNYVGFSITHTITGETFTGLGIESFEDFKWWVDHWALYTVSIREGWNLHLGGNAAFRQQVMGVKLEWSSEGGPEVWEVEQNAGANWNRTAWPPGVGSVGYSAPEAYTIEARLGPTFDTEAEVQRWFTPSQIAALPLVASAYVPPGSDDDTGPFSGSDTTAFLAMPYAQGMDAVAPYPFDWEAAYAATEEAPYIAYRRAIYTTLSLYSQGQAIDAQGLIDGVAAVNEGLPGFTHWQYTGTLSYSRMIGLKYPGEVRIGTYAENWQAPIPTEPEPETPALGYFLRRDPNLDGLGDRVEVNFN